jgi:hypothetical protein
LQLNPTPVDSITDLAKYQCGLFRMSSPEFMLSTLCTFVTPHTLPNESHPLDMNFGSPNLCEVMPQLGKHSSVVFVSELNYETTPPWAILRQFILVPQRYTRKELEGNAGLKCDSAPKNYPLLWWYRRWAGQYSVATTTIVKSVSRSAICSTSKIWQAPEATHSL